MADYISREAAIAEIQGESGCDFCWARAKDMCKTMCHTRKKIDRIASIPAADVRPVVRGRWQSWKQDRPPCKWYSCDYCGFHALNESNYCPNCGADMREEVGHEH